MSSFHYNCNGYDFIIHSDRENHKYVQKLKVGDNLYRYFYSQEELEAYLKNHDSENGDTRDAKANELTSNSLLDDIFGSSVVINPYSPNVYIPNKPEIGKAVYYKEGVLDTTIKTAKKKVNDTLRDGRNALMGLLKNITF